jgi:hypothetical protein
VVLSLPLRHKDATQSLPYPLPSILDSAIDSTPTNQTVKSNTMTRSRFGTTTSFTRSCSGCGR